VSAIPGPTSQACAGLARPTGPGAPGRRQRTQGHGGRATGATVSCCRVQHPPQAGQPFLLFLRRERSGTSLANW